MTALQQLVRPCIDLHQGAVKQIVGSSLVDDANVVENFTARQDIEYYVDLYRQYNLTGGHVICLGEGNDVLAKRALQHWQQGLQIGGGIHLDNAEQWLQAGASHVIVTSCLFDRQGEFQLANLQELARRIGKQHIVIDLSCLWRENTWQVAINRWQTPTSLTLTAELFAILADYCDEFLIHAINVEGKQQGFDVDLVRFLQSCQSPAVITYAGGIRDMQDVQQFVKMSQYQMPFTVGSALDIFGGSMSFVDLVTSQS